MTSILLIEDDELVRGTLAEVLASAGHSVVEAKNGLDGVVAARRAKPALVIIDMIMPEQDGIETLINLRAGDATVPILAISGGGRTRNLDFLAVAASLGATRTLPKPFAPAALLAMVEECLAPAPARGSIRG